MALPTSLELQIVTLERLLLPYQALYVAGMIDEAVEKAAKMKA
jgi:hypothetical protein